MTAVGGVLPPMPTTVGAGRTLPEDWTVMDGLTISVVVRFVLPEPPGRNSETVPLTRTASPTATSGAELVKTKMPSEVAVSASGAGSWIQNPLPDFAVTMPVVTTVCVLNGDVWVAAWMS